MVKGRVQILHSLPENTHLITVHSLHKYTVKLLFTIIWIFWKRSKPPLTILLLGHPDVRIVTKAGLTEDGEVCILPVGSVVRVCRKGHRHPQIWILLWKRNALNSSVPFLSSRLWNFYCSGKNFCMLDILIEVCRAQYYDQVEHRGVSISLTICVKIEKNALQSLFIWSIISILVSIPILLRSRIATIWSPGLGSEKSKFQIMVKVQESL